MTDLNRKLINYFNPLFFHVFLANPKDDLLEYLLRTKCTKKRFSTFHKCSADELHNDSTTPPSLFNQCLIFLHLNLVFKTKLHYEGKIFVHNFRQPYIIDHLPLPSSIKEKLFYLYQTCQRHCLLAADCPAIFTERKYVLKENTDLFFALQSHPLWDKANNAKIFDLADLLILVTAVFQTFPSFNMLPMGLFANYLKRNCYVHSYTRYT